MKEVVYCKKCGQPENVVAGHLTEEGKASYICSGCRREERMPMEARIAEKDDGKKILVEG